MFIIKDSASAVASVRDLINGEAEKAVTFITPSVLTTLQDTHEFINNGEYSDAVCFQNGKLFTVAGGEVADTQSAYKTIFDNLSAIVEPADYGKVIDLILNRNNKPSAKPLPRGKRADNTSTPFDMDDLTKRVTEALKAGKIPVVLKDDGNAPLSIEVDLSNPNDGRPKRDALRKHVQAMVETDDNKYPGGNTRKKWENTPADQRHEMQDWIAAAKDKMGI